MVTVTMYCPGVFTVMDALAELSLHWYDVPPLAVSVVVSPWQMVVIPLMVGVGNALTVK